MSVSALAKRFGIRLMFSGLVLSAPAMMSLNEVKQPDPPSDMYRNAAYQEVVAGDMPVVRETLTGRSLEDTGDYPPAVQRYFRYYGFTCGDGVDHRFGSFPAAGRRMAAHLWLPPDYRAVVIVLHGYLTHTGTMDRMISRLVREGYAVAAFDLPGHGLSDGPRVAIDSFAVYGTVFGAFLDLMKDIADVPVHVVAHSTGGATVLQYLFTHPGKDGLGHVVLVAPLVRSALWEVSRIGYRLVKSMVDDVPRVVAVKISSDEDFLSFIEKNDPLQSKKVPLTWVKALFAWNERLENIPISSRMLTVIQGDKDRVVDWKYNIPFIKEKFPQADVHMIGDGRHELLNEEKILRESVIDMVLKELAVRNMPR